MRLALALGAALGVTSASAGLTVWKPSASRIPPEEEANPRLANVPRVVLEINWEALVAELAAHKSTGGDDARLALSFLVDEAPVECLLGNSEVLSAALLARHPSLHVLEGGCANGAMAKMAVDTNRKESFSASFEIGAGTVLVDYAGAGMFASYRAADARRGASPGFSCGTTGTEESAVPRAELARQQDAIPERAYKFRVVVTATRPYAMFHGGKLSSVLAAISTMLQRVNGVYLRELGVYFTLIDKADRVICHEGRSDNCMSWPNNVPVWLLRDNPKIIESAGIAQDEFDVGHAVCTSLSGRAEIGSLCDEENKAKGVTGQPVPVNDPFWVDFVSHEIGHQFRGYHSFRNCKGASQAFDARGANEPGSGSSIMGYAGICTDTDLQPNSDPYFNSKNLALMRAFLESRVAEKTGCGEVLPSGQTRPVVDVGAPVCVVPKGNAVQLTGRVTNLDDLSRFFFAWDRVDSGRASYLDRSQPRFRSWIPSRSETRFLPNMYFLTYGLGSQLGEIPPSEDGPGVVEMDFRFTARSRFAADAKSGQFALADAGSFGFADVRLEYTDAVPPLRLALVDSTVRAGESLRVTWTGGPADDAVELLVAVIANMPELASAEDFRYERDLADLVWVSLGVVPNSGEGAFMVPRSLAAAENDLQVNVMIRAGSSSCAYLDLVPRVAFQPASPIAGWTCNADWYNVSDGCDCSCGTPDPDCLDETEEDIPLFCYGYTASADVTCNSVSVCVTAGNVTVTNTDLGAPKDDSVGDDDDAGDDGGGGDGGGGGGGGGDGGDDGDDDDDDDDGGGEGEGNNTGDDGDDDTGSGGGLGSVAVAALAVAGTMAGVATAVFVKRRRAAGRAEPVEPGFVAEGDEKMTAKALANPAFDRLEP